MRFRKELKNFSEIPSIKETTVKKRKAKNMVCSKMKKNIYT